MQVIKYNFEWTKPTINSFVSPLQGLGNLAYPIDFWLSPAGLINNLFYKYDVSRLLVYIVLTLELFFEVYWLGCCLKLSRSIRFLGSWLAIIFIMPFFKPAMPGGFFNFYPISTIIPDIVESIAMVTLIVALIIKLDISRLSYMVWISLVVSLTILYLIIRIPVLCLLGLPLVLLFSLYWVTCQISDKKSFLRAVLSLVLIYLPLILPFIYFAGCFVETPAAMLPNDFAAPPHVLGVNVSNLFSGPDKVGWIGTIFYLLGLAGAFLAIQRNNGPSRIVAIFYVIYSLLVLAAGLFLTFVFTKYRVPATLYYEWFAWPYMFIYCAFLFHSIGIILSVRIRHFIANSASAVLFQNLSHAITGLKIRPAIAFILGSGIALAVCGYSTVIFQNEMAKPYPYPYPPSLTPFNLELVNEVGLTPGSPWKGCVATLTQGNSNLGTTWQDQSVWDFNIWHKAGNEYRGIGLWWLNIPTLFVYNPNVSADYYYLVTRLFAQKSDVQLKEVTVLTKPNIKLLGLLGVHVLLMDKPLPVTERVEQIINPPPPDGIYAYRLDDFNSCGFSVKQTTKCGSVDDILQKMTAPDFDPTSMALVDENLNQDLTPASNCSFSWGKNEVRIKAQAPGQCLLVMPLQYSHYFVLKQRGLADPNAHLIRTDLALTGILFSQSLDATIYCNYGPYSNVFAKFEDYYDLKRLSLR